MSRNHRELTGREKQRMKKLIISCCANYDKEYGCLPLSGTLQNRRFCGERRSSGMNEIWSGQTEASDMELVTTSECPMFGICYTNSALCRRIRNALLPTDPELEAVFTRTPTTTCKQCGKPFPIDGKRVYCSDHCAEEARRHQTAARVRKHREKKNSV